MVGERAARSERRSKKKEEEEEEERPPTPTQSKPRTEKEREKKGLVEAHHTVGESLRRACGGERRRGD